jgi:hypothetical protein
MDADVMTVPPSRDQAQAAVRAAMSERDAIQANLLDLDGSFGKRLLAGATLTGESKRQWDTASAALAALWDKFSAYSAVLDRANEILTGPIRVHPARLAEAADLIYGPSVVLASPIAPLGQRELTAGAQRRLTLRSTVAEMKYEFPRVAATFTAAETVWNEISDGLRQVGEALAVAKRQLPGLGDTELANALAQADADLNELRDRLNSDPFAFWRGGQVDRARLDRLRTQAASVQARADEIGGLRDDAERRIAEVSATVSGARQAWQDAMAARERVAAKITIAAPQEPLPDVSGFAGRLASLQALKANGSWVRLGSELDQLTKQAGAAAKRCRDAEQATNGLLDQRDELRGRLEAYRAKAARLGAAEHLDLDQGYQQAKAMLWSAPCDLTAASAAVTGYQEAVLRLDQAAGRP